MQTVTVDIINDKAMKLLQDLELLQLIRVRREKALTSVNWAKQYKGAMSKQSQTEIDSQLNELRSGWE
ncbi:hypothetical protein [Persicitalea sp.]|uniref:hypothetical protein n=1 Tax=Persicitalea sp. TaxID=3100273 RepID=UPI003593DDD2